MNTCQSVVSPPPPASGHTCTTGVLMAVPSELPDRFRLGSVTGGRGGRPLPGVDGGSRVGAMAAPPRPAGPSSDEALRRWPVGVDGTEAEAEGACCGPPARGEAEALLLLPSTPEPAFGRRLGVFSRSYTSRSRAYDMAEGEGDCFLHRRRWRRTVWLNSYM